MLAGEYSVLNGEKALAATIDAFLTATLEKAESLELRSNLWDKQKNYGHVSELISKDPYESCVARALAENPFKPFSLNVNSELQIRFGVGSSSALRLACTHVISNFIEPQSDKWKSATLSLLEQRQFQKRASGYDIATQVQGGIVEFHPVNRVKVNEQSFRALDFPAERLNSFIRPMVGPTGSPTGDLMEKTLHWLEKENRFADLDRRNRNLIDAFHKYFESDSIDTQSDLLTAVGRIRKFFVGSPNYPEWMNESHNLPGIDKTWSFKMTGAGGEDAVLLVGDPEKRSVGEKFFESKGWSPLPFKFSSQGLTLSEISDD
jgi:mevalonate kinase